MSHRMPGAERAYIEEGKVLDYLLKPEHEVGGPKARFFLARGFTRASWRYFAGALVAHGRENDVAEVTPTGFGLLYEVRCVLRTPDGRDPCIRTIWQVRAGEHPRLVTAYPF
jgi:hypothetical protein